MQTIPKSFASIFKPTDFFLLQARSSLRLLKYAEPTRSSPADEPKILIIFPALQVEAQEKPKTPKGRALKRHKYTRRFVNVTLTGGKRKVRISEQMGISGVTLLTTAIDEPQPRLLNELDHD